MNDNDVEELGPIDYLVIEFPAAFARRELDGTIVGVEMSDLTWPATST